MADFTIGGQDFNVAVSDERPYQRATAQFRKEQFDSTPTVGDQSLTGWWTRGQLSFHKGAGVRYYEVLDGETVLNRFYDSDSVDISEAGQLTLLPSLSGLSVHAKDCVAAPLSGGGGIFFRTSGSLYQTGGYGAAEFPTSDLGVPTSLTTNGTSYFVVNGDKLERQNNVAGQAYNYVTNPSFEAPVGISGWTTSPAGAGTGATISSYTGGSPVAGNQRMGMEGTNNHYGPTYAETILTGLTVGTVYRVELWLQQGTSGTGGTQVSLGSTVVGVAPPGGGWTRVAFTHTAAASSETLRVSTYIADYSGSLWVDAVMVVEDSYTGGYFDGSSPGCAWLGTAHASVSAYGISTSGASVVTHILTGDTWDRVFWAKGRLFAVDTSGRWYQLPGSDTAAAVATTDAFWNSGQTGVTWSLADGPGPVYISNGQDVYAIILNDDGSVPTLAAPITVLQMPVGETIARITCTAGFLVLATSRGVRVAPDSDNITLGPLVVEGDFSACVRMGVYDTRVYVVGRPEDRAGENCLVIVDLGETTGELRPAWSIWASLGADTSTASGAVVTADGVVYAWVTADLYLADPTVVTESGYVETGYHRFGTLDPKAFHSVLVRTSGNGGTVEVFRVEGDGTETSLGTVTAGESETLPIGMATTTDRLALRLTLNRDAVDPSVGPTLIGYQIKALPAPERQRMIRIPLELFDTERNRPGRVTGKKGSAWARLSALEAMEASGGITTYTDHRTGETGSCFIEAVEHEGKTPPSAQSNGYGGIVFLTLRKV